MFQSRKVVSKIAKQGRILFNVKIAVRIEAGTRNIQILGLSSRLGNGRIKLFTYLQFRLCLGKFDNVARIDANFISIVEFSLKTKLFRLFQLAKHEKLIHDKKASVHLS